MNVMFTKKDLELFKEKNIKKEKIEEQIKNFEEGFPYIELVAPATIGNGVNRLSEEETDDFIELFEQKRPETKIIKFVPASGAASRMFKHLFEFTQNYDKSEKAIERFLEDQSFNSVYNFISSIHNFAFFKDLAEIFDKKKIKIDECLESHDYNKIIDNVLKDEGLGYSQLPKALIKFHYYDDGSRMALEEHLVESAAYCKGKDNNVDIQFTISPEHESKFLEAIKKAKQKHEKKLNVTFRVTYSFQKPSTDNIAVDMKNQPFRNEDGTILFRPGGHGALIENLNDLESEIIFVKNIDNIVPDKYREPTNYFKKVLGGYLIFLRDKSFEYLRLLEGNSLSEDEINNIENFARTRLNTDIPDEFKTYSSEKKKSFLFQKMNRPIRVCGMVKNEGEPGGGPFWVKNEQGVKSLQIVEMSQIDKNNSEQIALVEKATHFNPVDLVCSIKNYKGEPFNLKKYVDPSTGFISIKSKDGKNLKAQELPGLWNGAMADWITIFIETPIITFNPVKTVNDLLRPNHQ